ncbi:Geranylgeranyl pyrophosphate synthetase [Actinomycetales bacterium JB111]|nr:Geranylgeranyl pyrophosphate synthetase [Actinomycetales bacterium JB111]
MAESPLSAPLAAVRDAVGTETTGAFDRTVDALGALASHLGDMVTPARALLDGGKRARALLAFAGYVASGHSPDRPGEEILAAGAALELFQLAALVHDDVMDGADSRRGLPAAHVAVESAHRARGLAGNTEAFGRAGAILLGDLLLASSSAAMDIARASVATHAGLAARGIYDFLCAEVAAGQYLDVVAAATPLDQDAEGALDRALMVLRHKSARYSVEHPLALGAALGGADARTIEGLRAVGAPLGEAFQLRDDELGVFGDPDVTGKPAGDDLREGKRTALLALTWRAADATERADLARLVGSPDLTPDGVARLREIITDTGARSAHEDLIASREKDASIALAALSPSDEARELLVELSDRLVNRSR